MELDFQQLLLTLLPDLAVVVALFAALGVDYSKLRGAALAKRYESAFRISALGLLVGLVMTVLQAAGKMPFIDSAEATHGQLTGKSPATHWNKVGILSSITVFQ